MGEKNKYFKEDEIDLLELFQIIWNSRKTIIKFFIAFSAVGLFIAVFSPKEYTATMTVVPQTSVGKVGGGLNGIAAIAGVDLRGGNTESISPSLYPKIVQSIPFQRELLKTSLNFYNLDKKITYQEYYKNHKKFNLLSAVKSYTIGLPGKFLGLFKEKNKEVPVALSNDSIYRISTEDRVLFNQIQNQLIINDNSEEGFIEISFSMPEALPAAQMTKKAQMLLQKSITNFKIQKAQEEYVFIEQRYNEMKKEFVNKQAVLANFRDRNQGLVLSRSQSRLERLQSEYSLAFSLYSELAKQLETQKIKLKENTPVFTIIDPVSVPVNKSKPKRLMILFIWTFLGLVMGIVFILVKNLIKK